MGGEIEKAVREVREQGLLMISLNMPGSVPEAADLVVTDPVQAGIMAVTAVADTAKFNVARLKQRGSDQRSPQTNGSPRAAWPSSTKIRPS